MRLLINLALLMVLSCALTGVAGFHQVSRKGKVLVLLDSMDMQETHSKFFQNVKNRGFEMEFATISTKSVSLRDWDVWQYDKLMIFGGSQKLGSGVKPSTILEFFNEGRDVLLALDETASSQMRDLSSSLGIDVAPGNAVVIDHFHHDANIAADHTAVVTSSLAKLPAVFGSNSYSSVLFKGVGLSVSRQTEVAFHAITAERTGYAGIPGEGVPQGSVLAGQALGLVSLVQGRNNARAAVIGSAEMFSNKFLAASKDNAGATVDIVLWTFHQRGVLQASPLRHRIVGGDNEPAIYRINDMVEVAVDIMECGESGCVPFVANDIQIEFVMLDPYIRTYLSQNPTNGNGTYSTIVKVPDTYGVFKWVLTYHRLGYSWLDIVHTVPVRPFRHYEYERFIVQAYPYYASTISMMAGFFALGFLFLYSR